MLLIVHGLLCFARNYNYGKDKDERVCEVRVGTKAPEHKLTVLVCEILQEEPNGGWRSNLLYQFSPERPRDVPGREIIFYVSGSVRGFPLTAQGFRRVSSKGISNCAKQC